MKYNYNKSASKIKWYRSGVANVSEFILDCQAKKKTNRNTHFDDSDAKQHIVGVYLSAHNNIENKNIVTNWNASDIDSNQSLKSNKTETHIC